MKRYRLKYGYVVVKIEMPNYTGVEEIAIRLLMKKSREWGGNPIPAIFVDQTSVNEEQEMLRGTIKFKSLLQAFRFCKHYGSYF